MGRKTWEASPRKVRGTKLVTIWSKAARALGQEPHPTWTASLPPSYSGKVKQPFPNVVLPQAGPGHQCRATEERVPSRSKEQHPNWTYETPQQPTSNLLASSIHSPAHYPPILPWSPFTDPGVCSRLPSGPLAIDPLNYCQVHPTWPASAQHGPTRSMGRSQAGIGAGCSVPCPGAGPSL